MAPQASQQLVDYTAHANPREPSVPQFNGNRMAENRGRTLWCVSVCRRSPARQSIDTPKRNCAESCDARFRRCRAAKARAKLPRPSRGVLHGRRITSPAASFTQESAIQKVRRRRRLNGRNPEKVAFAYTEDSEGALPGILRRAGGDCAFLTRGRRKPIIGSSRSCGPSTPTASPCASLTNGATTEQLVSLVRQ